MSQSNLQKKADLWSKLRSLQSLTVDVGILHQAQVDQLKLWGRLAFQRFAAADVEIAVDFLLKDVKYVLRNGKLDPDITKQATLIAGLDRSIAEMLGEEWRLIIEVDGTSVYKGHRRTSTEEKVNETRKAMAGVTEPKVKSKAKVKKKGKR